MKKINIYNNNIKNTNKSDFTILKDFINYKYLHIKREKKKHIKNFIGLVLLFIGRYLYVKSLNGCYGDEYTCVNFGIKKIIEDIYYCIAASFIFMIFLFLLHLKLYSSKYIIIFFIVIIQLIYKDHGESYQNHGLLNFEALTVFLLIGEIINLLVILILKIIFKKKYFSLIMIIVSILMIFSLIYYKYKDKYFCKNWDKGLNNTYIDNNPSIYPCSINIPKKCLMNIISPFLDFSAILKIRCENRKEKEKHFLKDISNLKNRHNITRIGFPITIGDEEEIKGKQAMYSDTLLKYVKENLIDIDNYQLNKTEVQKNPEVIVDFRSNPYGEMKIKINFDKNLSIKRKLSSNKNNNTNSILFIYLDNLSRTSFYRQYKKTSKFIKKFLKYKGFSNKNDKNQNYHGFEFLKYHKFNTATIGNAIPMFSGVYFNNKYYMVSIVKELKELGYITCNVQDVCHKELMGIDDMSNYSYIEFDHEYSAPNCDPNVYIYGYGLFSGENGALRKCLYGKESFDYSLEYARKFWKEYKTNKRFLRIVNTYAHDYIGEKSKYTDGSLYKFLNELFSSNELNDTIVFIAGDHGFALMGIYEIFNSDDYKIEFSLPVFFLLVPDKNNHTYNQQYSEIIKNQQIFITPFDIYYTIRHIVYGEDYKKLPLNGNKDDGECLFKYIDPSTRTCNKYQNIKESCQCKINQNT
jgi:hypothetical protein